MSQIETVFKYNGQSYAFDARDAEDAERIENAVEILKEQESKAPKEGKSSVLLRYQCDMIKGFFDNCLGTGAGTAICSEKSNVAECYAAYQAFLEMVSAQKDNILAMKNTFGQYSNRQQRRHPNGKK